MSVGGSGIVAGSVAFEICESYRVDLELDEPICAGCGHLADDHGAEARPAEVRPLRRRPSVRPPARKAS